ncbi:MAG: hypothetical protein JWR42_1714 [Marmoricola sp.]|nr:hypothetical protein [Marmoricola sp.]
MGALLVLVLLVEYVVLPELVGAGDDVALLSSAQPALLVVALALEVASLVCFTLLTRATLPRCGSPAFGTLLRIDLTGYGVSHVMPGGGATAAAFRYRLLTRAGVASEDAFTGAAVQTAAALVTLIGAFLTGAALSLQGDGSPASMLTAGVVSLVLLGAIAAAAVLLTVRGATTLVLTERLLSLLHSEAGRRAQAAVEDLVVRLTSLGHDRRLLVRTVGWAGLNWLLDAACLWCCLAAYGHASRFGPLLAIYGVVNLLAMLPITPGGLGVVEGILIPSLVSTGAAPAVAVLGVLTWRLGQYWMPIPVAVLTYLSLRWGVLRHDRRPAAVAARTDTHAP